MISARNVNWRDIIVGDQDRKAERWNSILTSVMCTLIIVGILFYTIHSRISKIDGKISAKGDSLYTMMTEDSIATVIVKLGCKSENARPYAIAVAQACKKYKIDWKVRSAQITQESGWQPDAKSFIATQLKGDKKIEHGYSLSQMKPSTGQEVAGELGEEYTFYKLLDGVTSIRWGTYYLSRRSVAHGHNISKALRAYGAGDSGMKQVSTNDYYNHIKKYYLKICQEFNIKPTLM